METNSGWRLRRAPAAVAVALVATLAAATTTAYALAPGATDPPESVLSSDVATAQPRPDDATAPATEPTEPTEPAAPTESTNAPALAAPTAPAAPATSGQPETDVSAAPTPTERPTEPITEPPTASTVSAAPSPETALPELALVTPFITAPFNPVTDFNIDGNVAGPADWAAPYGPGTTADGYPTSGVLGSVVANDPCGAGDTTGFPGSQKQNDNPWSPGAAGPNDKADLCSGGAAIEVVQVGGTYNYILYQYWSRQPSATGDMSTLSLLEGPLPGRGDDRLVSFNFDPSGGSTTVTALSWSGSAWVTTTTLDNTMFQSAVGANVSPSTAGAPGANAGTFAEIAVNLTAANVLPANRCESFTASTTVSRTGNSASAELQDYLTFPTPVAISSCGSLTVRKETLPAGTSGGPFTYVIAQADGGAVHDAALGHDADPAVEPDANVATITGTLTVPADSLDTWTSVIGSPDYTLAETSLPAGWATQDITCTYLDIFTGRTVTAVVHPSGTFHVPSATLAPAGTACTITNATSAVRVAKVGAGSPDDDFVFHATGQPDVTLSLNETSAPMAFAPGTLVDLAESLPASEIPWDSYGVTCVDDSTGLPVATAASGAVAVTTVAGHVITCTFVNQQRARVMVTKDVLPDGRSDDFEFVWSSTVNATDRLADGETSAWHVVAPNTGLVAGATPGPTPSVGETPDANYALTGITCSDADSTGDLAAASASASASYMVSPGESVNCTFVNTRRSALVTLLKEWSFGAAGDTAQLSMDASEPVTGTGVSTVPADAPDTFLDPASALATRVWVGDSVVVGEELAPDNAGVYGTQIVCRDELDAQVLRVEGTTATVDVTANLLGAAGDADMDGEVELTCVMTNAREVVDVRVQKSWLDAVAGDTAELTVVDIGTGASDTATSTAGDSDGPDDVNVASVPALTGGQFYVNETVTSATTYISGAPVCTYADAAGATQAATVAPYDGTPAIAGVTDGARDYLVTTPSMAGATVQCGYTNRAPRGTIVIVKAVDGADGTFAFTQDWLATADDIEITTADGVGSVTAGGVLAGTYTVAELDDQDAYDFTRVVCVDPDGGSSVDELAGTIDLDDGETVTCTYTNTERATLVVIKDARPDDGADFDFATTSATADVPDALSAFTLDDDADDTLANSTAALVPGNHPYLVTESAASGWAIDGSSNCVWVDADGVTRTTPVTAPVAPAAGSTATCTFVNVAAPASLTLEKSAVGVPDDYGWRFDFTLTPHDPNVITLVGVGDATGTATVADLVLNEIYTLAESPVAGWTEGALACTGLVDLDPVADGFQFRVTRPAQAIRCAVVNTLLPGALALVKSATLSTDANGDGVGQAGDEITWTFEVTNESEVAISNLTIDDPLLAGRGISVACESVTLAAAGDVGDTTTCTAGPSVITADDVALNVTIHNVAIARGTLPPPPGGGTPPPVESPEDDADVPLADLTLDKQPHLADANNDGYGNVGETISWSFTVTNIGAATIEDVTIDDPFLAARGITVSCDPTTLAAGASVTCTSAAYTITAADVAAGSLRNVATAAGTFPGGDTPIVTPPDETETPLSPLAGLGLVKRATLADTNGDLAGNIGETVTWSFVITNTGGLDLVNVAVDDPLLSTLGVTVSCPRSSLAVGESMTCTSSPFTIRQSDVDVGTLHNVATATGGSVPPGCPTADVATCDPRPISSPPSSTDTRLDDPPGVLGDSGTRPPPTTTPTTSPPRTIVVRLVRRLPRTGGEPAPLFAVAAACIVGGLVLLGFGRRRRHH